jgi:hypothetical protein
MRGADSIGGLRRSRRKPSANDTRRDRPGRPSQVAVLSARTSRDLGAVEGFPARESRHRAPADIVIPRRAGNGLIRPVRGEPFQAPTKWRLPPSLRGASGWARVSRPRPLARPQVSRPVPGRAASARPAVRQVAGSGDSATTPGAPPRRPPLPPHEPKCQIWSARGCFLAPTPRLTPIPALDTDRCQRKNVEIQKMARAGVM